MDVASL